MRASTVLKTMVLALAGMVLVFFLVGMLLADRWQAETQSAIAAPPTRIAALLGDFDAWESWSAMKITLGAQEQRTVDGKPGQVGHRVTWKGKLGSASLVLTRFDDGVLQYDYHSQREGDAAPSLAGRGRITWKEGGEITTVVWFDESSWADQPLMQRFAGRWIGWFGGVQERVRQIQTSSLAGLQRAAEAAVPTTPNATPVDRTK